MLRVIYIILMCFATALATLIAWLRGLRDITVRQRLADRWGRPVLSAAFSSALSPANSSQTIWLHAASMGEVQAGASLVRQLLAAHPHCHLIITTMTATGAARVHALFGKRVMHCYLPYDLPMTMHAFLDRVQPKLVVILETELWPNLLHACKQRKLPVLIASARISPRTAHRYCRLASLFRASLIDVTIFAQTELDAERFRSLGATHVTVSGNLKFDIEIADSTHRSGSELRLLFDQRPCWVAGSTHEGEEIAALHAHQRLLQLQPNALLMIVPRHPQRFASVEKLLQLKGFHYVTRSSNASPRHASVWLIDTMGELLNAYAASDLAFVGGSLVTVGGHNLLEPAALGLPVIGGPYFSNSQDVFNLFREQLAMRCVSNAEELSNAVVELMQSKTLRAELGARGKSIVDNNRSALARTMTWINEQLSLTA